MITNVLVANRGEIARRVFRTCRELGLGCTAVHSDADAEAPYVAEADAAVHLPGNAPAETYLRPDLLIAAARTAGADAVHPGYGFLSENADFARQVTEAGLTWIGPPPAAIESMGSKIESKRLMAEAGVPVLAELDPGRVTEDDLPVLVKASAGGGGRGMRIVRRLADLAGEIEAARSEAAAAFGDGAVFCEPYLEAGRHIEVQVLADAHGTVWAVGERECSIQRRHQKVIEEAPSPLVSRLPGMRDDLFEAARKAAAAIDYVGAGTVEFLASDDGRFFFLEMNTRLQVEHPVTELTTGLDLVALQLTIADGGALPADPPASTGHAIEVRLYAEDPSDDWRPQTGTLHAVHWSERHSRVRVDSGVESGSVVSPYYDPMLAKVICWAPDRTTAARRLAAELTGARIHGVVTNRDLLARVLRHEAFLAGKTDTAFFERHGLETLAAPLADEHAERLSAIAAALALAAAAREQAPVVGRLPIGWRNVVSQPQRTTLTGPAGHHEVGFRLTRDGLSVEGAGEIRLIDLGADHVVLENGGVRRRFEVAAYDGLVCVDSSLGPVALRPVERFGDPAAQVAAGSLLAPMPGTVIRVAVAAGDQVAEGQPLLWMEAMKMEHTIAAPVAGVVTELPVSPGVQVEVGAVLAVVKEEET